MESGSSYYFEVYAVDESRTYQISPAVRSESKMYYRPEAELPAPNDLKWNGTKIVLNLPGISQEMTYQFHVDLYYSPTKDGEFKRLDGGTWYIRNNLDLQKKMKAPGYYKYTVYLISKDIQKARTSAYSAFSPVYHYTK